MNARQHRRGRHRGQHESDVIAMTMYGPDEGSLLDHLAAELDRCGCPMVLNLTMNLALVHVYHRHGCQYVRELRGGR